MDLINGHLEVSIVMGYPHSWMVFFMENPNLKWMMTGGTPMTQETPISGIDSLEVFQG